MCALWGTRNWSQGYAGNATAGTWGQGDLGVSSPGGAGAALEQALATTDRVRTVCWTLTHLLLNPTTLEATVDTGVTLPLTDGTLTREFLDDWLEQAQLEVRFPDPGGTYLSGQALAPLLNAGECWQLTLTRTAPSGTLTTLVGQYRVSDRPGPQYSAAERLWTVLLEDRWRGPLRAIGSGVTAPTSPSTLSFTDMQGAASATAAAVAGGLALEGLTPGTMGTVALAFGWYLTRGNLGAAQHIHLLGPWESGAYPTDFTTHRPAPLFDPYAGLPANRELWRLWTGAAPGASAITVGLLTANALIPSVQVVYAGNGDLGLLPRQLAQSGDGVGYSCDPVTDATRYRLQLPVTTIGTQRHRPEWNRVEYEMVALIQGATGASTAAALVSDQTGWAARHPYNADVDVLHVILEKVFVNGTWVPPFGASYDALCQAALYPKLAAADRVQVGVDSAQPPPALGSELWLNVPNAEVRGWYRLTRVTVPLGGGPASYEAEWSRDP